MGDRNPETNQWDFMLAEYRRLEEENAQFRRLLIENGITIPTQQINASAPPVDPDVYDAGIDAHSGKEIKIALFRDLFRGRQDVYALRKRFRNGDGVTYPRPSAIGRRFFLHRRPFERRSTRRLENCCL